MANHLSNGYAATAAALPQHAKVAVRLHKWRILLIWGFVDAREAGCDISRIYGDSAALRRMPSFFMRLRRVLGFTLSRRAAP